MIFVFSPLMHFWRYCSLKPTDMTQSKRRFCTRLYLCSRPTPSVELRPDRQLYPSGTLQRPLLARVLNYDHTQKGALPHFRFRFGIVNRCADRSKPSIIKLGLLWNSGWTTDQLTSGVGAVCEPGSDGNPNPRNRPKPTESDRNLPKPTETYRNRPKPSFVWWL